MCACFRPMMTPSVKSPTNFLDHKVLFIYCCRAYFLPSRGAARAIEERDYVELMHENESFASLPFFFPSSFTVCCYQFPFECESLTFPSRVMRDGNSRATARPVRRAMRESRAQHHFQCRACVRRFSKIDKKILVYSH